MPGVRVEAGKKWVRRAGGGQAGPHSQSPLAEELAGCPRAPVPLDVEGGGHPIGCAGEGLATMARVDAR